MRRMVFVLVLVVLMVPAALADDAARMPRFEGESFEAPLGPGGDARAVLNVSSGMVSLYVYFPKQDLLRLLWSLPAEGVRSEAGWKVSVPSKGQSFELGVARDGKVEIDGNVTALQLIPALDLEGMRVETKRADCAGAALEPPAERDSTVRGREPKADLMWCGVAFIMEGCCRSCFCVHRSLDIPYWMDGACCGFGC